MEAWQGPRPGRWGDGFRAGRLAPCGDRHSGGASRRGGEAWHPSRSLWAGLTTGLPLLRPEVSATHKVTLLRELSSSISGRRGGSLWPVTRIVIGPPGLSQGNALRGRRFQDNLDSRLRAGSRRVVRCLLSRTSELRSPTKTPSFSCPRPSDAQGRWGRGGSDKGREGDNLSGETEREAGREDEGGPCRAGWLSTSVVPKGREMRGRLSECGRTVKNTGTPSPLGDCADVPDSTSKQQRRA